MKRHPPLAALSLAAALCVPILADAQVISGVQAGGGAGAVTNTGTFAVQPDTTTDAVNYPANSVTNTGTLITFTAAQLQGMKEIDFSFSAVGSSQTVAVDQTNDGFTTPQAAIFQRNETTSQSWVTSSANITTANAFVVPVTGNQMRIKITAGTGTATLNATVKRTSSVTTPSVMSLSNGQVASGSALAGSPVRVGASDGTNAQNLLTAVGQAAATSGTGALAVEQDGYTSTHITTAATTTVKSGRGYQHELCISTSAALATLTAYDNTAGSGTVLFSQTMPASVLQTMFCGWHDIAFATGLTIVTTGTQDITVTWR